MPSKWFYLVILTLLYYIMVIFANQLPKQSNRSKMKRSLGYREDHLLNFTEQTGKYGYMTEEHKVVTEDGYILTVFRIVSARNCRGEKRKPPVVLMHGLLQSSDAWIDSGPNAGLAYLIADACHDIWLGNTRGNYYSRSHVHLDPDTDAAYWQFSVDEIGYYDLPAVIDYVLHNTKMDKVNYIGFSQGAGTFFVMCSERPGYCDKTELMIALAPSTRHLNTRSEMFRVVMTTVGDQEKVLFKLGIHELLSKGGLLQNSLESLCPVSSITKICEKVLLCLDSIEQFGNGSVKSETIKTLFGHFPVGTSVHNLAKYGRMLTSYKFEKFDYGKSRNLELYGAETPPLFNLDAVTVPVLLLYGENDAVVDVRDIEWLVEKLPHVIETVMVRDPFWSHLDFTYSQRTNKLVFPKIYEYLLMYSLQHPAHPQPNLF